jgi:high-affinity nickel-transport protein
MGHPVTFPWEGNDVDFLAAVAEKGFRFGVLLSALGLGFRHGIDWDHIAAITDITSSQEERRTSLVLGTVYALGHALVVLSLGVLAIVAGKKLPEGLDEVMPRIVGATLVLLGVYVFTSLIRHGRDFRLRSRWMLVFAGVRRGLRWVRARTQRARSSAEPALVGGSAAGGESEEDGPAVSGMPSGGGTSGADPEAASSWHHGHHGLPGHHHHARPEQDDAFMNYSLPTAFGVGMIHGIGAETASQLLIFLAVAGAGGAVAGLLVLLAFVVGLLASNTLITVGTTVGFLRASKNFGIYATVAILTGLFSLTIGTIFLVGKTTLLPAIFGG